jgi:dTDP-4-amino-4,6-dideoxygalactose transaminase
MNKKLIKFNDLYLQYRNISNFIEKDFRKIIRNTEFINGSFVKLFEKNFKKMNKSKFFFSTNSGTDSLFIALKTLGLKQGEEVITTAHSWISTSASITQAGGKVVFCDTDKNTFNIDASEIEKKITKKTKGIIVVHLYGQPCDLEEILEIAKKYNLWIIEDCAQAHFAEYKKKYVGNFGDISTFSFFPSKNLGAYGDAGGLITNKKSLYISSYMFAKNGGLKKNQHLIEGINSRMDTFQAAVLNCKLKKIFNYTKNRIKLAKFYSENLENVGDIITPMVKEDRKHVFHLYVIKSKKREKLKNFLQENNIEVGLHYPIALPFLKAYKYLSSKKKDFINAYTNQKQILSLPIFPEMKLEEVSYVCKKIKLFFKNN